MKMSAQRLSPPYARRGYWGGCNENPSRTLPFKGKAFLNRAIKIQDEILPRLRLLRKTNLLTGAISRAY